MSSPFATPPSRRPAAPPTPSSRTAAPRNLFEEQARNRRITWALIVVFVLFLAFLGFGFDLYLFGGLIPAGPAGLPVPIMATLATVIGSASAWSGYRYGDRAVLASAGARPVAKDDRSAQVLMNVVTEMSIASGLSLPQVYVVEDPDPNAFATGRDPEHASIAVTRGLLATMNREELQGVIAHEMSHIRNYDIRTMTVIAALVGAVVLLSDWASRAYVEQREDRDRRGGNPLILVAWLIGIILAPILGQMMAMAVSRTREYLADASSAELTRNPLALASALRKLDAAVAPTRAIARGTAHLCITDPLGRQVNTKQGSLADLFATHPPIQLRIARLEQMGYKA